MDLINNFAICDFATSIRLILARQSARILLIKIPYGGCNLITSVVGLCHAANV